MKARSFWDSVRHEHIRHNYAFTNDYTYLLSWTILTTSIHFKFINQEYHWNMMQNIAPEYVVTVKNIRKDGN